MWAWPTTVLQCITAIAEGSHPRYCYSDACSLITSPRLSSKKFEDNLASPRVLYTYHTHAKVKHIMAGTRLLLSFLKTWSDGGNFLHTCTPVCPQSHSQSLAPTAVVNISNTHIVSNCQLSMTCFQSKRFLIDTIKTSLSLQHTCHGGEEWENDHIHRNWSRVPAWMFPTAQGARLMLWKQYAPHYCKSTTNQSLKETWYENTCITNTHTHVANSPTRFMNDPNTMY